jgi:hypothetical protein
MLGFYLIEKHSNMLVSRIWNMGVQEPSSSNRILTTLFHDVTTVGNDPVSRATP